MREGLKLLAAAALHPGLRSVLLFDATPEQVDETAKVFAVLLGVVHGGEASVPVRLGWHDDEDALWGVDHGLGTPWRRPGLLTLDDEQHGRLVVASDLTRLSLAAQRAFVQMAGANCVSLERHRVSRTWRPRVAWLAACPHDAVGQVSPHLLDRFALRWTGSPVQTPALRPSKAKALHDWLDGREATQTPPSVIKEWSAWLLRVRDAPLPSLADLATHRLVESLSGHVLPGLRPYLSVARLAVALAWLDGETETGLHRIDEAVGLLGLEPPARQTADSSEEREQKREEPKPPLESETSPVNDLKKEGTEDRSVADATTDEPNVVEADDGTPTIGPEMSTGNEVVEVLDPWPESQAPVEREWASLQPPLVRPGRREEGSGVPVGVRPTSDPREMALLPTLFAAAPFQKIRKERAGCAENELRWILEEMDLRTWRRTPVTHEMLVLVLDATSFGPSRSSEDPSSPPRWRIDWPSSLVPHLRWAYVNRASVGLVLVGTAEAADEFRAERLVARSVLVPSFQVALDCTPGRATPLADALQLALETLRHALQHGRDTVHRARLVVLSDGRGNVPLSVSRGEPLEKPVGRKGVEDSLEIAREFARLRDVEVAVLDPQPAYARHLVEELAEALGAVIEVVPRVSEWRTQRDG